MIICEECIHTNICHKMNKWTPKSNDCVDYYEKPKKGKWIKQENKKTEFFCSECGRMIDTKPFTRTDNFPFCHCGADMRGEEE